MKRREKKERNLLAAAVELGADDEAILLLLAECGGLIVVTMKTLLLRKSSVMAVQHSSFVWCELDGFLAHLCWPLFHCVELDYSPRQQNRLVFFMKTSL